MCLLVNDTLLPHSGHLLDAWLHRESMSIHMIQYFHTDKMGIPYIHNTNSYCRGIAPSIIGYERVSYTEGPNAYVLCGIGNVVWSHSMIPVLVCSATGLSPPMLVASADVSDTADWRRIAGRTPPLPVDAGRLDAAALGGCCV